MLLRIYWGRIVPGSWDIVEQRYQKLFDIERQGLLGRLVTQDTNDPQSMFTVTIWESMEALNAWESSQDYKDVFLAALEPFLEGSHTVSLCEVKLCDLDKLMKSLSGK